MLSAVFGTVKSLLSTTADKQETSSLSSEDVNSEPPTDKKNAAKCPYDGLEYGQFISNDEDDDTKEKSSFSGKVTDLLYGYGLIDNNVYFTFDCVLGGQRPAVGDSVVVQAVRDHNMGGWKATKVDIWQDWENDETGQNPQSGTLIGKVTKVSQDSGFINETVAFDQDSLVFGYKPCRGDWIQGDVTFEPSSDKSQARNVRPLREQKFSGSVTHLYPGYGHVNGKIYFTFRVCEGGWRPKKGDLVEGRMMESQQSKGNWRAISMKQDTRSNRLSKLEPVTDSPLAQCMKEDMKRNKGGITISDSDLGFCLIGSSKSTIVHIRNVGRETQTLTNYEVVCPTGDVSVQFSPASSSGSPQQLNQGVTLSSTSSLETTCITPPIPLPTQASVTVTLTVTAKQLGRCLCQVTYHFDGFSISRLYTVNAKDQQVIGLVPEGYASGVNRSTRNKRRGKMAGTREGDFEGCVFPGVRPPRNFDVNVPVKLPQFPVPRDLRTCLLQEDADLVIICPQLLESLSLDNFSRRFSALLHLEEIRMDEDMRQFDMERVSMRPRGGEFLSLEVPGLAEGRPSVLIGDKIVVTHPNTARYDGYVHEVLGEAVLLKFHPSFHELYQAEECSVMFTYSRTSLRRCHQACEFAKNLGSQVLFPTKVEAKPPQESVSFRHHATSSIQKPTHGKPRFIVKLPTPQKMTLSTKPQRPNRRADEMPPRFAKQKASKSCSESDSSARFVTPKIQDMKVSHVAGDGQKMAEFINPRLNTRQRSAVMRVLQGEGRPTPYIIFGPPGTGKTVTVVEAILQVHIHLPASRILACTPSNSAADLLTERLHESGKVNPTDMVRLNAFYRSEENIPDCIKPYSKDGENLTVISHQRIIICTCTTAGSLYQLGLKASHFTHVFVDEAGQATEPECLIPVGLSVGPEGQIILAGDPMQLGPVLSSHVAKHYGLGQSYLERLILRTVYRRDADKYRDHGCYDPLLVTKLVENYRSHPALLGLSSKLFYDNELLPRADPKLTHSLTSWEKLPNRNGDCPLLFNGVMGDDMREGNSPSWFNPVEVVQVIRYVQTLLNSTSPVISPEDVGIITPYRKQVEKMRLLLVSLSIHGIKVGSVEEFQGQERVAMIISTVRSSEDLLTFDLRHHLGFLSNPKRFNVSITRAQALMIIVGNPHLLAKDKHWRALIRYCMECGAYTGCQPPTLPPEEYDNEEELLDGSQEPDMSSPRQQESKMAAVADTSSVLEHDYQLNAVPASQSDNGFIEQEAATKENGSSVLQKTAQQNEALEMLNRGINSASPDRKTSVQKDEAILADVDADMNSVLPRVQIANTNNSVPEESQGDHSQEIRKPDHNDKVTSAPNKPNTSELFSRVDELSKGLHQADLSSEQLQSLASEIPLNGLRSKGSSTSPSVEPRSNNQRILLDKEESRNPQSEIINGVTRAKLGREAFDKESSVEKKIPVIYSGAGILDAKDASSKRALPHSCMDKKPRGHSSFSFSSSSDFDDAEDFSEFLDENDLNKLQSTAALTLQCQTSNTQLLQSQNLPNQVPDCDVMRTHQDEHFTPNQEPSKAGEAKICQEDRAEVMLSRGRLFDPDKSHTRSHASKASTTTPFSIRDHVSFTHSENQPSPSKAEPVDTSHILIQIGACPQETLKSVEATTNSEVDSIQVCDEEEDPEIWDEEYDISRVPPQPLQEARYSLDQPSAGSEQQSEETEKWDDYTWDVKPRRDPSFQPFPSFQEPLHTPETDDALLEDGSSLLGSHEFSQEGTDKSRVFNNATHVNPQAKETGLVEPDHEMPPLEGWSQEGIGNTENVQEASQIATIQPATNTQVRNSCKCEKGEINYPTTPLTSQSSEPADRTRVNNDAKSSRPFLPGLGRGRGILTEKFRQAGQSKKLGGRTSPFKNPWKISAPTYSNSPKATTSQQPRRQVHQTNEPRLDTTRGMKHDNNEMMSPRANENLELRTQGCERQDAMQTTSITPANQAHNSEVSTDKASQDNSEQSGGDDDSDDWSGDQHPPFLYKRPVSNHQKGGKWKYTLQMGSNAPRSQTKRYTTDEDFMGDAAQSVSARKHDRHDEGCMRTDPKWKGAYPIAESPEMMEDYDVIIESNDESSDCANTPQRTV
ncbi:RNA helicase Mov10l1-like [Patiria miniata]|uniref:RNA helicase n=1 Tax=Patiria miniata TaxID=46514 RepID=A0A913ZQG1_PATMI|nr:RNA helicase Mov10l1-like [Patiria miniata]XP_038054024.1 RNA helicase Mov10l1-like [Patiria miniata]